MRRLVGTLGLCGVVAGVVALGPLAPRPGRAAAACLGEDQWTAEKGRLTHGARCGEWIGSTDAAHYAYSNGVYRYRTPALPPYDVHVTWQRLGGDGRTLEIFLPDTAVMLGDGKIGLWTSDQEWRGWEPHPSLRLRDEHRVVVEVRAERLRLVIDGELAGDWASRAATYPGEVAIAQKAAARARATIRFRDFAIVPREPGTP